ncbi:MAG: creatininase family protein [Chitinivibrionales bacterium]|nr:creatininase family protein [Chitinivibrionales bacterium]
MENNSIFSATMADMTYQEIEQAIKEKAIVLFPIGVIEEHGPHLPLGTDTYLVYAMSRHIQKILEETGVRSIIMPPFYWGINQVTRAFAGSFSVKFDTMKAVLKETIECLDAWGFRRTYLLNMHGDFLHAKAIVEVARDLCISNRGIRVYTILPQFLCNTMGLSGQEPYIVIYRNKHDDSEKPPHYFDVHAGGFETSLMLLEYETLVDEKKARTLQSSKTTLELLKRWQKGGDSALEVTPLGYCGDPSQIDRDGAEKFRLNFARATAELIKEKEIGGV